MPDTQPPLAPGRFPVTAKWSYLNNAGMGPIATPTMEAVTQRSRELADDGELAWGVHSEAVEQARVRGAQLMGVPSRDVAFVKNTTEGVAFVANGLAWRPGDRVVVVNRDFPSTLYPWTALQAKGVQVDLVEPVGVEERVSIDSLAEVIRTGPAPKVVAVSWIQFRRGWRIDLPALAELCRDVGALLCADVIQGLGVLPVELDRWGIDFAMADGHKWLLGPQGSGLFYVRADRRDLLTPLEPGWNSMRHREEWDNLTFDYDDSARRFEGGMPNIAGISGLGTSIGMLLEAGPEAIWAHVRNLLDHACEGLERLGAELISDRSAGHRSPILSFRIPGQDPNRLYETLKTRSIVCGSRGNALRISPHGYNSVEEIDNLLDALRDVTPQEAIPAAS
ncbi:aminotransferase class V-fold PLP-dependent enzyme [Actinocrispum wychmicini]|nr:aminotransferase class V-fold PLP-dependent enzyme [Actinocrispum wychmicini]